MTKELLQRRKNRNSYRIKKNNKGVRPILSVFKSNKNIYTQIVDMGGKVLLSVSSKNLGVNIDKKTGIEIAELVGAEVARKSKENNIEKVVFNKGPYLYIGRVKALADSARQNGLDF